MFNKLCPHCNRRSFSASAAGAWLCPYCGEDITTISAVSGNQQPEDKGEEDKK